MMKQFILAVLTVTGCLACHVGPAESASTKETKTAETWEAVQQAMVPGADASSERPYTDVLSEKEVLLKAVDYALKEGALNSSYYIYQENPALLTAKIETPVLLHFIPTGTTNAYLLTAVDTDGANLANFFVNASADTDINSFEFTREVSTENIPDEQSAHRITKREAVRLIKNQFPDKQVSEPIALSGLRLEDSPYSNYGIYWYFTVNDESRSAGGTSEEYIIASEINGWKSIAGGLANRAAISGGSGGSPYLNWNRMARLDTPLRLFDKIEAARSANEGRAAAPDPSAKPIEKVKFTPVPLR